MSDGIRGSLDAWWNGEASPEDADRIEAWLAESPEHRRLFAREAHLHAAVRDLARVGAIPRTIPFWRPRRLAAAAALLLAAAGGGLLLWRGSGEPPGATPAVPVADLAHERPVPGPAAGNLLANCGFEEGGAGWRIEGLDGDPAEILGRVIREGEARTGARSIRFTDREPTTVAHQQVAVVARRRYRAEAWALSGGRRFGKVSFSVIWKGERGEVLGLIEVGSPPVTEGWARLSAEIAAPEGAASAEVLLARGDPHEPPPPAGESVAFDDLYLGRAE